MSEDMLATLQAIDPALLTEVVRQDQQSPTFEILDWNVKRLSDKGIVNPDGLFMFSGQGHDERGTRSWSVVLKNLKDPGGEAIVRALFYWKREALLIQSGVLENLPGPVVTPRFYGMQEHEGSIWVWMEYIVETKTDWTIDDFVFAANQVGRFNAACLTLNLTPDYPWLCKGHLRSWLEFPASMNAWENPFANQAFSSPLRDRFNKFWNERERFLSVLDRLPQVFSHFDLQRRNLMIRQQEEGRKQLVAIDWAFCGHGALGGDAFSLIGDNMIIFEVEPAILPELETAAYAAYMEGLTEGGWQGNPQLVRLGYTAWTALFTGAAAPALVAFWTSDNMQPLALQQFGRSPDEIASSWAAMCEFSLDCADEARQLMDQLGF